MGWEVVFAPQSESDLAKIVSYIGKDDQTAAIRFGETLITKAESLGDTPMMGPLLPGKPTTRFLLSAAIWSSIDLMSAGELFGSLDSGIRRGIAGRQGETLWRPFEHKRGDFVPRAENSG